jgi:transcriptional regulator with XRE-family HTH domain
MRDVGSTMAFKGVDMAIFECDDMRRALAQRDIGTVYRILVDHGVAQRYLAELVGQSQSEVSEILNGRQVQSYDVLVRVAEGLGVSRGALGLAYAEDCEGPEPFYDEVTEEMRRRALLAAGAVALFGRPVLGEVLELPDRPASATPLPDRLGVADVEAMRELTCKLEVEAQYYGGGVEVLSPVATRAERLLRVPAADATKQALVTTLADLHNVAAWAAFDSHQDDTSRYHFARAMSLGNDNDGFQYARAAYLAGVSTAERGHFNDGIKLMQLGQMRLSEFPRAQRAGELAAWINADMACALGHMGATDVARSALARARGGWQAPDADDEADMQWVTALVEMHLGRADSAEQLVSASVRRWSDTQDRRQAVLGRITLAQLHVQAGDSNAPEFAHQAIGDVRELRSMRARERLRPLVQAMEERPEPHYRELSSFARRSVAV